MTPTMETIYRGSGAVENLSISDCPAIQSFKTAGQVRADSIKTQVGALAAASMFVGIGCAVGIVSSIAVVMSESPGGQIGLLASMVTGAAAMIFASTASIRLLNAVRARIDDDTKIMLGLKVHARALEDKVSDLRAALNDAQGAGEAAGERGTSPAATVHGINAKTARRFQ